MNINQLLDSTSKCNFLTFWFLASTKVSGAENTIKNLVSIVIIK
jgi:hypothetical protein